MADLWNAISKMSQEELVGPAPPTVEPPEMPVLTVVRIKAIVARLVGGRRENGYLNIAKAEGVPKRLVLRIERLRQRALRELAEAEAVVKEIK